MPCEVGLGVRTISEDSRRKPARRRLGVPESARAFLIWTFVAGATADFTNAVGVRSPRSATSEAAFPRAHELRV